MNPILTRLRWVVTSVALATAGFALAFTESDNNNFFGTGAGNGASTTGSWNSFFGGYAGDVTTSGNFNTFVGFMAGDANTTGSYNVFSGTQAGYVNIDGDYNVFSGYGAGINNIGGNYNVFFGTFAGFINTTGSLNTALGHEAGLGANNLSNATAIGAQSQVDQSNSLVLGSVNGVNDATSNVNVGIGTTTPARQLHLKGDNAVFRMDRSQDAAAFMLVRTNASGTPLKTFVVGASASGSNNGTFVINDLGTAVGGNGTNRMTIYNDGSVHFTGTLTTGSSIRFKHDVSTLSGADVALNQLRGVRFIRNDNGKPDIGLIAEEVAQVYPELVGHHPETGAVEAVNYQAFVGVLIEGFKAQQATITAQQNELNQVRADYQSKLDSQQQELSQVRAENQAQRLEMSQVRADQNQQLAALREQLALLEVRLAQGTAPSVAKR